MVIYLVVFGASIGLFYIAQNVRGGRRTAAFFSGCAIFLPALLAGLRDYSIGTDVLMYGNIWFNRAVQSASLFQYCSQAINSSIGLFYALFNYIVSRFSSSPHVFYFFYALVEILIVYLAVKKIGVADVPFAMFVYYCVFYNMSLNLLRQSMALVVILYGFSYIKRNRWIPYLISVLIAYLFHSSAIIGIALYILHIFINKRNRKFWQAALVLGCGVAMLCITQIADFIVRYGLVGWKYARYLTVQTNSGGWGRALFFVPIVILFFLFSKAAEDTLAEHDDLKMYAMFSLLLSVLGYKYGYAVRITLYFDIMFVVAIPVLVRDLRIRVIANAKNYTKLIFIVYLLVYWIYKYVYKGSDETVPYIMMEF